MRVLNQGNFTDMTKKIFQKRSQEGITSSNLRAKRVFKKGAELRREVEKNRIRTIAQNRSKKK